MDEDMVTKMVIDVVLKHTNTIIDEEMKVARELNPQMAMGMLRIKELLNEEFDYNE